MQVQFDQEGCFIQKEGRIIVRKLKSAMFAKSTKACSDIELWHKRIGRINLNKLKAMKSKGVFIRLLTFKEKEIEGVCEVRQFGKKH